MSEFLEVLCSSLILAFVDVYIWNKLLKEKIKIFCFKNLLLIFLSSIVIAINYLFNNAFLKITCITFFCSFIIKIMYNKPYIKCLCTAVFSQIIFLVSDMLFALLVFPFYPHDIDKIKQVYFSKIYSNLGIGILSLAIINFFKIKSWFKMIIELLEHVKKQQIIILLIAFLFSINLLLGILYYEINYLAIVLIISILLLIYTYITLQSITQQENIANIRIEYDQLMDKSVEYEQVLDENKRDLHELKNDFSVLHVLIEKSKSEALNQLDFMIKEYGKVEKVLDGSDKYYYKTLKVPSGGLRGLLSTKLKLMEEQNINYNLRIGHCINSKMLEDTNKHNVRQVGKLLGIYLDNSISAVKNLKDKNINIEIYSDGVYFNILISNNLGGVLELDKVGTMGYTTNGSGHGYGLSLAKEILKNNNKISVSTQITGNSITKIISLEI